MIHYIFIGLISGLVVFLTLFLFSFLTLGVVTGCIHLVAFIFRNLFLGKTPAYREQPV